MTLPELVALVQKAPATLIPLAAAATAVSVALGAVGTAVERVGEVWGWPWLEKLGQRIEATFTDLPKLARGSRYTAQVEAVVAKALGK